MALINKTRNTILAENVVVADRLLPRAKGLLGRQEFKKGEGLILRPCNSVHTFFMRFPIDVLFMDRNNRVVKTIAVLKPFRASPVYFSASWTIELPAGTISATGTIAGDIITVA